MKIIIYSQEFHFSLFACLCSGSKLATVTNTILEIAVSQHAFGSVYGEDGSNLHRLREVLSLYPFGNV